MMAITRFFCCTLADLAECAALGLFIGGLILGIDGLAGSN